jgi:hypothetical protein
MKESPDGRRPGEADMSVTERELMITLAVLLKNSFGADSRKKVSSEVMPAGPVYGLGSPPPGMITTAAVAVAANKTLDNSISTVLST